MTDEMAKETVGSIRRRMEIVDKHGAHYMSIHKESLRRILDDAERSEQCRSVAAKALQAYTPESAEDAFCEIETILNPR